jgi:hypothetical protein
MRGLVVYAAVPELVDGRCGSCWFGGLSDCDAVSQGLVSCSLWQLWQVEHPDYYQAVTNLYLLFSYNVCIFLQTFFTLSAFGQPAELLALRRESNS